MLTQDKKDFWSIYFKNKTLIEKCFRYLYNKYPSANGVCDSFDNVTLGLFEHNVFERFSVARLVEGKFTKDFMQSGIEKTEAKKLAKKKISENSITSENISESYLNTMGIDKEKKWQQFIYKWIEQILSKEYTKHGKHLRLFVNSSTMIDYGVPKVEQCFWGEEIKPAKKDKKEGRPARKAYPSFNNRLKPSEEGFDNQLDTLIASDIRNRIYYNLKKEQQRKVFLLAIDQGLPAKIIANKLHRSESAINYTLGIIRCVAQDCALNGTNTTTFEE